MLLKRKNIIIVLLVVMIVGIFSLPIIRAQDTVTLEWWTVDSEEYSEQVQRDMATQFEAENPNIKVNVTVLPEEAFTDKMTTTLGAGQGAPDVAFFWDNNWFPQALDLTPFLKDSKDITPDMYFPNFWKSWATWQDKVVGLPLGVGANFVMYNKDIFDKAGVAYPTADWTTDDYLKLVKQMNDPSIKRWGGDRPRGPFRAIWRNYNAFPYSDDSMKVDGYLNSDASVAAYTWLWDLVNTNATPTPADLDVLSKAGTGPIDLFLAGRLAMGTLNQGHMLNAMKAGMNFGLVPEPKGPGADRYANAFSLVISIWKGSAHPNEAWKFLSYWGGPKGQQYLMENGNLFPSLPAVLNQYKNASADYVQSFFKVLELKQVVEWNNTHPCNSAVLRAAQDVWDSIMLGKLGRDEIKGALDGVVAPSQAALDECRGRLGG